MAISVPDPENNHSPDSDYQKKASVSLEQTPVNKQMSSLSGYTRETKSAAIVKEMGNSSSQAPTAYKTGGMSGSSGSNSKSDLQGKMMQRRGGDGYPEEHMTMGDPVKLMDQNLDIKLRTNKSSQQNSQ